MKATSCWTPNRLSDNFIANLTQSFYDEDYETGEREYKRQAEVIVSCNYIVCDEKRSSDSERMTDYILTSPQELVNVKMLLNVFKR